MSDNREERRVNWPQEIDPEFWFELRSHMQGEEKRMKEGDERMNRIEADLRPLTRMYHTMLGSAAVGTALLATLLFIYNEDRQNLANMQKAILTQGVAIEKLIQAHAELEKDYRRDFERIDRDHQRMK